jgi:hypothetical protein
MNRAAVSKASNRLTDRKVQTIKPTGKAFMVHDGYGLYLRVGPTGAKSWVYRYRHASKRHDFGLGSVRVRTLADARKLAVAYRLDIINHIDPLAKRQIAARTKIETAVEAAKATGRTLTASEVAAQLYRHFNDKGVLLYVGIAHDGFARLREHGRQAPWFCQIAFVTLEHFATREEAEQAEHDAIVGENPLYNVSAGNRPAARARRKLINNVMAAGKGDCGGVKPAAQAGKMAA